MLKVIGVFLIMIGSSGYGMRLERCMVARSCKVWLAVEGGWILFKWS